MQERFLLPFRILLIDSFHLQICCFGIGGTVSFLYVKVISCPLRRVKGFPFFGLLRGLRCHAEYSEPMTHSLWHFRLGKNARCIIGFGFRPFLFTKTVCTKFSSAAQSVQLTQCSTAYVISFRRRHNTAASDCRSGSLALILVYNFSSHHSVVALLTNQLMTFSACYFPLWVSPTSKQVTISSEFLLSRCITPAFITDTIWAHD